MLNNNPTVLRLINYKGKINASWTVPKSRGQAITSMKQLIAFYYRCKEAKLLLPNVDRAIKAYAEKLLILSPMLAIIEPCLIGAIKEIKEAKEYGLEAELVQEKLRKKEDSRCSICRVRLKYPAYVVWRQGLEVKEHSKPVGIICLNNRARKLNDLVIQMDTAIAEMKTQENGKVDVGDIASQTSDAVVTDGQSKFSFLDDREGKCLNVRSFS